MKTNQVVFFGGRLIKATIVIPTYWRGPAAGGSVCEFESDYIYDHAAPLDSEGTLGRALESLGVIDGKQDFTVVVVAVPTRPELKQAVEMRVQTIVAGFEYRYPVMVIGPEEIMLWRQRLANKGLYHYDHFLSLDSYASVRNVCLLAAVLSSADVAILFDDNGVIEDPLYVKKALEFIGGEYEGCRVAGVTGYYRQDDEILPVPLGEEEWLESWQEKWGGIRSLKEALSLVASGPRLKKSPFACSGSMVIHRDVFENVPFDPSIPRGEDIDYLMNARLFGVDFFLDNDLWIGRGCSPVCAPPWYQLRLDIIRFARERAKLKASDETATGIPGSGSADFDPYPGRFLKDDLHDIVFETSIEMAGSYLNEGREDDATECIMNIAISRAESDVSTDPLDEYMKYREQWREFIGIVPDAGIWQPDMASD